MENVVSSWWQFGILQRVKDFITIIMDKRTHIQRIILFKRHSMCNHQFLNILIHVLFSLLDPFSLWYVAST